MDQVTLRNICINNTILSPYFVNVVKLSNRNTDKNIFHKIGSYIICNICNCHWFVIQKKSGNVVNVFDSGGGLLLPSRRQLSRMCKNLLKITGNVVVHFDFKYGSPLQDMSSFTCSEHVISYLLYELRYGKYKIGRYQNYLMKKCKVENATPDEFVWWLVYNKEKLAEKPDLKAVTSWYENLLHSNI